MILILVNERVIEIRKKLRLNQKEFAKRINLSQTHLSSIECGVRELTGRVADDIARVYNVNKEWLLYGKEPVFIDFLADLDLHPKVRDFMKTYSKLTSEQQKLIMNMANEFLSNSKKTSPSR